MPFAIPKNRPYMIAEAGVNHNGDPALALRLIDAAAEANADAVKFQLFDPDELASASAPLASYQERSGKESQRDMLRRLALPQTEYAKLKTYAESKGLDFIASPFDAQSARFLANHGVKAMKIPSGEITNLPFLSEVANLGIFTIISTGMSDMEEVRHAVAVFRNVKTPFALLHCVSCYPAPTDQINLRAMETLRKEFSVPVGFSDHTKGIAVAVTAAAMGAEILEKHFTLDKTMVGPDHAASLEPDELAEMVRVISDKTALKKFPIVKETLGAGEKRCQPCEENVRAVARRSVVLVRDARQGTVLHRSALAIQRPGTGIPPKDIDQIVGKTLQRDLAAGTVLTQDMLA